MDCSYGLCFILTRVTSGVGFAIASAFANLGCSLALLVDLHDLSKPSHGQLMLGLVGVDLPKL
jgi:hypothetical protein